MIGMQHVRLGYDYLSRGDIDGYGSLLDADTVLLRDGRPPVSGRAAVERFWRSRPPVARHLDKIACADGGIVALGRMTGTTPGGCVVDLQFRDTFTLSDYGLLLVHRAKCHSRYG